MLRTHAFITDPDEPMRVRHGQEDVAHCAECGQAEDRPIHRGRGPRLTRYERLQGLADRGVDTWDDYRGER